MEAAIILSVKYKGECKLVSVTSSNSFSNFVSQIIGKWVELHEHQISCLCTVGGMINCCLDYEVDFRNLLLFCHHSNVKIVAVDLCPKIRVDQSSIGTTTAHVQSGIRNQGCARVDTEKVVSGGVGHDHPEVLENVYPRDIPYYDVCPNLKKKPLLSDAWANIIEECVGQQFVGGAVEFRKELIKYSTRNGFSFKYIRNDRRYIHAVCTQEVYVEGGCGWFIKARRQNVTDHFEISKANLIHRCLGRLEGDQCTRIGSNITAELVEQNVKNKPTISGREIIDTIKESYSLDIPYWKAWRAVEGARDRIFGSYDESYDQLRWYCTAIQRTNPGSVVILEPNEETHHFERVFIAFKACVDGFRFCRPMLFIDGTFMKGRAKGTLLSATAKDGNNGNETLLFD
ncbi:hypothetical protein ACS0TY_001036 [Phlomoides rotata]